MEEKQRVKEIISDILKNNPFIAKIEVTTFKDLEEQYRYFTDETKKLIGEEKTL